jgi:hypothetical protein
LMAHGYYPEAMVLARDSWEVALTLAAIKKQAVPFSAILPETQRSGSGVKLAPPRPAVVVDSRPAGRRRNRSMAGRGTSWSSALECQARTGEGPCIRLRRPVLRFCLRYCGSI